MKSRIVSRSRHAMCAAVFALALVLSDNIITAFQGSLSPLVPRASSHRCRSTTSPGAVRMKSCRASQMEWKEVVAGFIAASVLLTGNPVASLADGASPPVVNTPSVKGVSKIEGEIAATFKKAQAAGSAAQFGKARKLYDQVVKYAPGYVYGWSNRANVLVAEGDLDSALADYDRAIELAADLRLPDKWIIYLNRGTTLLAKGEEDKALADLDQAASINNRKDLYTLANRAQAYERRGEWQRALNDYQGAVDVQPGNVQPWWIRYALVLFEEGRDFDSLAYLRRLQAKFDAVSEVQAAVSAVEFSRGDLNEAKKQWSRISPADQKTFLTDTYLKDKLKWPPRAIKSLKTFDREALRPT